MKKFRIIKYILFFSVIVLVCVSAKAINVNSGEQFTVRMSCGDSEGTVHASGSDGIEILSSGNWCDRGSSVSVTGVATKSGTVSLIGDDVTINASTNPTQKEGITLNSVNVTLNSPSSGGGGSSTGGNSSGSSGNNGSTSNEETTPEETPEEEMTKSTDNTLSSLSVDKGT